MAFYTYMWLREDGTPYYVGKGWGVRAYVRHRVGNPPPEYRIVVQEFDCESDAFFAESFLIHCYGRKDLSEGCLTNLTNGGEGRAGGTVSEEQRKRVSQTMKGRSKSLEHRRNLSKARLGIPTGRPSWNAGKKLTEEHKHKLSLAKLGKPQACRGPASAAARANMSAAHMGHIPWNKGLKHGRPSWNKGLKTGSFKKPKEIQEMC